MARAAAPPISSILKELERRAPAGTAEDWDNVGLLAGDPAWRTPGVVVSIDLTAESIALAKRRGYRLIVNHHPCIFPRSRGLSRVTPPSLVFEAVRSGIAVAASHTNFDQCAMEVVESVSRGLGCVPKGRLVEEPEESLYKLAVFVPEAHVDAVREAVFEAGAGHIGNYDSCAFGSRGEGTFRGGDATRPFLGKPGRLERADEVRLETVLPRGLRKPVLEALRRSHPYEEVAFDLYELKQGPASSGWVRGLGYGFWGEFPRPRPFSELARDVKRLFKLDGFWLTDPPPRKVRRIAFVAGKGSSFLGAARSADCEVFITGEAGYHSVLDGKRRGMAVMELGHRESERFFIETMKGWLTEIGLRAAGLNLPTQRIWPGGVK